MTEVKTILLFIDQFIWLFDVMSCAIFYHIKRTEKQINSSFIALVVMIVLGGIMAAYTPHLQHLYEQDSSIGKELIFAWHAGFAGIDMLAIIAIWIWHWWKDLPFGEIARYMTRFFLALGTIQVIRWIDRMYLGTDILGPLYASSIASINYTTTAVTFMIAIRAARSKSPQITLGKQVVAWKI